MYSSGRVAAAFTVNTFHSCSVADIHPEQNPSKKLRMVKVGINGWVDVLFGKCFHMLDQTYSTCGKVCSEILKSACFHKDFWFFYYCSCLQSVCQWKQTWISSQAWLWFFVVVVVNQKLVFLSKVSHYTVQIFYPLLANSRHCSLMLTPQCSSFS